MPHREPSNPDLLRWEQGPVDPNQEHFRLFHREVPNHPVALVGPRDPGGLLVQFPDDLPASVRNDLRDELWSWCTPPPDDAWFDADLWHNLVEFSLDTQANAGTVRWELVARPSLVQQEISFVESMTTLYRTWLEQAALDQPDQQRNRAAFLRDYVSLSAFLDPNPQRTITRLARLVRLQTGQDPTARYSIRLIGVPGIEVPIRLGHVEDFDFARAWACAPYHAFVLTKLQRPKSRKPPPTWRRNEVRSLLYVVDNSLASEVPCAEMSAEIDGPHLHVRMRIVTGAITSSSAD